jgi:predicted permease
MLREITHALRGLVRNPAYSATAVLTLTLAVGATAAIFSVVDGALLKALPYEDAHRLVFLSESEPQVPEMSVAYPNYEDWRQRSRVFESMGIYNRASYNLTGAGDAERLQAGQVAADLFKVTRAKPILGRVFTVEEDRPGAPRVTLLGEGIWRRRFGASPNIVGTTIRLNDNPVTVVGVLPAAYRMPTRVDIWVPVGPLADEASWKNRGNHPGLFGVARLRDGVDIEAARKDMARVAFELGSEYPRTNKDSTVLVNSLRDVYSGDVEQALWVLLGAVLSVLLVACANISNLTLARGAARSREYAVKQALGAGFLQMARSLLTETLLLSLIGGVLGIAAAQAALSAILSLAGGALPRVNDYVIDWRVMGVAFALTFFCGVLIAAFPLWQLRRGKPAQILGAHARGIAGDRSTLRSGLVIAEVALTVVLLAGAGLFLKSFTQIMKVEPGFDPTNLVSFSVSLPRARYDSQEARLAFLGPLEEKLQSLPGVTSAAVSSGLPLGQNGWQTSFFVVGNGDINDNKNWVSTEFAIVSPSYFRTLGMRVLRGEAFPASDAPRTFSPSEAERLGPDGLTQARATKVVVDQEFAEKWWPGLDPIGRRVHWSGDSKVEPMVVTGVVGRVKVDGLREESGRIQAYVSGRQLASRDSHVTLRTTLPLDVITPALQRAVRELNPGLPIFGIRTMEQTRETSLASERLSVWLVGLFGALALVLALIGLFGVMSYSVVQQTREIGVRVALGASTRAILRLFMLNGLRLAVVGLGLGWLLILAMQRGLQGLLFEVQPNDPWAVLGALLLVFSTAAVAALIPARRAALVDPVTALRAE